MSGSLKECCDQYIEQCKKVLSSKDATAARVLRTEATLKFHTLIPRWNAGLMASITHYYLDDIESILSKLIAFRRQLDTEGDRDYNETVSIAAQQHMTRQLYRTKVDTFEYTCTWIRDCYAASASEKMTYWPESGICSK